MFGQSARIPLSQHFLPPIDRSLSLPEDLDIDFYKDRHVLTLTQIPVTEPAEMSP